MGLPVQNVLPVCFKSGSMPVQKHFVCQYKNTLFASILFFHLVLAKANFGMPVQKIVFCTGIWIGGFMMCALCAACYLVVCAHESVQETRAHLAAAAGTRKG
jgi:hypothetical protein